MEVATGRSADLEGRSLGWGRGPFERPGQRGRACATKLQQRAALDRRSGESAGSTGSTF
jgi:hypothetical protein